LKTSDSCNRRTASSSFTGRAPVDRRRRQGHRSSRADCECRGMGSEQFGPEANAVAVAQESLQAGSRPMSSSRRQRARLAHCASPPGLPSVTLDGMNKGLSNPPPPPSRSAGVAARGGMTARDRESDHRQALLQQQRNGRNQTLPDHAQQLVRALWLA